MRETNLYAPSSNAVAAFLASVAQEGATAAAAVHSSLSRLKGWLRLELSLGDSLVTGWRAPSGNHVPRQQMPMETKEIYVLEKAAMMSEFWAGAAAARLIGLYGCIRYKPIQNSFLVQTCEWGWIFLCAAGKFVVGVRRQPFIWALPKHTMLGECVMPVVVKVLRLNPPDGKKPYLIRRWNAPAASPGTATAWKDYPLTQSQASDATMAVMRTGLGSEAPNWKDRPLPSYVARRVPATIAGKMGMSASCAAAWVTGAI